MRSALVLWEWMGEKKVRIRTILDMARCEFELKYSTPVESISVAGIMEVGEDELGRLKVLEEKLRRVEAPF